MASKRRDPITIGENYTIYNIIQYNHQWWYTNTVNYTYHVNFMFRPILFLAIIRLDTIIGEN